MGQKSFSSRKKISGQKSFSGQEHPPDQFHTQNSKNNWGPLSSTFHVEQPGTLIEWKFKSMTYLRTDELTWVGARDACASKNGKKKVTLSPFELSI